MEEYSLVRWNGEKTLNVVNNNVSKIKPSETPIGIEADVYWKGKNKRRSKAYKARILGHGSFDDMMNLMKTYPQDDDSRDPKISQNEPKSAGLNSVRKRKAKAMDDYILNNGNSDYLEIGLDASEKYMTRSQKKKLQDEKKMIQAEVDKAKRNLFARVNQANSIHDQNQNSSDMILFQSSEILNQHYSSQDPFNFNDEPPPPPPSLSTEIDYLTNFNPGPESAAPPPPPPSATLQNDLNYSSNFYSQPQPPLFDSSNFYDGPPVFNSNFYLPQLEPNISFPNTDTNGAVTCEEKSDLCEAEETEKTEKGPNTDTEDNAPGPSKESEVYENAETLRAGCALVYDALSKAKSRKQLAELLMEVVPKLSDTVIPFNSDSGTVTRAKINDNDVKWVELNKGCGVSVSKTDKELAIASSEGDPQELVKNGLTMIYGESLADYSAKGTRNNKGIEEKYFKAIYAFAKSYQNRDFYREDLSITEYVDIINKQCAYVRRHKKNQDKSTEKKQQVKETKPKGTPKPRTQAQINRANKIMARNKKRAEAKKKATNANREQEVKQ